jgi:XTP/dITP diphosphohydrolase
MEYWGAGSQYSITPLLHYSISPILRCMKKKPAINELLKTMARLRSPGGCPWDREQDHRSLRWHAVEEVYELLDAIEAGDDHELEEELGDLLLQVVFHCQLARERGAFDFEKVARHIADKLVRRHPHVFGNLRVKDVDQVWTNWEKIKHAEKHGTRHARPSALDGIPKHLPALLWAEKLVKKARRAKLLAAAPGKGARTRKEVAERLFALAQFAQEHGWSAEDLLRSEARRRERELRAKEKRARLGFAGS